MPRATVVIPNYNHAKYLPQRIESVLDQTFRDIEVLVLDDASPDNSREVIESYAKADSRVRTIFNERNSGSTFLQWNRGLRQAKGEYIWFAESDDFADPSLLETLVGLLDDHPAVGLAMCQSWFVDRDGRLMCKYSEKVKEHRCFSGVSRWTEDFVCSGREYCADFLAYRSTIPNASSVVFRRSVLEAVGGAPVDMRYLGDYMTYVKVLLLSDIAYTARPLNYFRQHPETVRGRHQRQDSWITDYRKVQRLLTDNLGVPERDGNFYELLPGHVGYIIGEERRPPSNKVPLRVSLQLLPRFARLDPRAFRIALRMFLKEWAASLAGILGLLGIARKARMVVAGGKGR